jgi:acetyl-CoA carboxylase carboxyl transferase subunit alpha
LEQKVIDKIVPEPLGGAHRDHKKIAETLKKTLLKEIKTLKKIKPDKLVDMRLEKFGAMGVYVE